MPDYGTQTYKKRYKAQLEETLLRTNEEVSSYKSFATTFENIGKTSIAVPAVVQSVPPLTARNVSAAPKQKGPIGRHFDEKKQAKAKEKQNEAQQQALIAQLAVQSVYHKERDIGRTDRAKLYQKAEEHGIPEHQDVYNHAAAEKGIMKARLDAIDQTEKSILMKEELKGPISEARRKEIAYNAQQERVKAYMTYAGQLLPGSEERKMLLAQKETEVLKAGLLRQEFKVACLPEGKEKEREAATIKRHAKFDAAKSIFRTPSSYSHEDATVELQNRKTLINTGRATMGGTKAMYYFQDMDELVDGQPKVYLFKEATNCIGVSKPAGAVVTGAASKLQVHLRGGLSIYAECVKDGDRVVGSMQEMVKKAEGGVDLFKWQAQDDLTVNEPSDTTKADLMHEHTLDWLLCNFDTKGENFINQPDDHIISFDKEASFNTLLQDESQRMSYTFKPHSNDTIYNTMFAAFAQGKINLDLQANLESIQRMELLDPDGFIDLFRETLDTKYSKDADDRREAERRLRHRHKNLREEYRRFYTDLINERLENVQDNPEEIQRLQGMLVNGAFAFRDES